MQRRRTAHDVIGTYSALVAPPTPVGISAAAISDADAMPAAKQVSSRHDLDGILRNLAGLHFPFGHSGSAGATAAKVSTASDRERGGKPSAIRASVRVREDFRNLPLALTYRSDGNIGADIFERDEPIGVFLVNFGEQVQHGRSHDENIGR